MINYEGMIAIEPLQTLRNCGGYYCCPVDDMGRRLGPLVGYAGKYESSDGKKLQYVGDTYANFAKADCYPQIISYYAISLEPLISPYFEEIDAFCGAPLGGYVFSSMLGLHYCTEAIRAEKKVVKLATDEIREQSVLFFGRDEVMEGRRYAVVEDVCNNFSTTEELILLINSFGGTVSAIICLLNRSNDIEGSYHFLASGQDIPLISLVRLKIPEYKQDDPRVADDIRRGNVVLKPKNNWKQLDSVLHDF